MRRSWTVGPATRQSERSPVPRRTQRCVCALCGILFALLIPPDVEETDRDKLCPNCLRLPAPPSGPDEAPA